MYLFSLLDMGWWGICAGFAVQKGEWVRIRGEWDKVTKRFELT